MPLCNVKATLVCQLSVHSSKAKMLSARNVMLGFKSPHINVLVVVHIITFLARCLFLKDDLHIPSCVQALVSEWHTAVPN